MDGRRIFFLFSLFKLGLLAKFLLRHSELNFKCSGASVLNTFGVAASCSRKKTSSRASKSCEERYSVLTLCVRASKPEKFLCCTHIFQSQRGKGSSEKLLLLDLTPNT